VTISLKSTPSWRVMICRLIFVEKSYVAPSVNALSTIVKSTTKIAYEMSSDRRPRTVLTSSLSLIVCTRSFTRSRSSSTPTASLSPSLRSHAICWSRTQRSSIASSVNTCRRPGIALK